MKPSQGSYRPQLDGLRAVCIIFTILHHIPHRPEWLDGRIGVDIFFALSGWLITSLLLDEGKRNGRIDIRSFYIRRITRIAPMYYVTLLLYGVAAWGTQRFLHSPGDLASLRVGAPWMAVFNAEYRPLAAGDIFGHSWTLSIEEKFYLFWPLIFAFSGSRTVLAFALSCAIAAALMALGGFGPDFVRGYFGLGFGAALAILVAHRPQLTRILARPATGIAAAGAMAVAHTFSVAMPMVAWNLAVSLAGAFLVAHLWLSGASTISRVLAWAPLALVGRLTFGIYLLHVFVLNVMKLGLAKLAVASTWQLEFALVYGGSIAVAYGFYRVVETPCIAWGRQLAKRMATPAGPAPADWQPRPWPKRATDANSAGAKAGKVGLSA